jgi:hypothetical protein
MELGWSAWGERERWAREGGRGPERLGGFSFKFSFFLKKLFANDFETIQTEV